MKGINIIWKLHSLLFTLGVFVDRKIRARGKDNITINVDKKKKKLVKHIKLLIYIYTLFVMIFKAGYRQGRFERTIERCAAMWC